jgi:hypothetical protein
MSIIAPAEAGPFLDRRIARLIDGPRKGGDHPPYSTDETAADELASRLEAQGITSTFERDGNHWYCVIWTPRPGDAVKERIASGSALTRPLAICRAVLNVPLTGSGNRLRIRTASRGWIGRDPSASEPRDGKRGADVIGMEPTVTRDASEDAEAESLETTRAEPAP